MATEENVNEQPKRREDEIDADITDKNKVNPESVDAVKTGSEKKDRYYDKPFDEQMYGSFADIRKARGEENDEDNQETTE